VSVSAPNCTVASLHLRVAAHVGQQPRGAADEENEQPGRETGRGCRRARPLLPERRVAPRRRRRADETPAGLSTRSRQSPGMSGLTDLAGRRSPGGSAAAGTRRRPLAGRRLAGALATGERPPPARRARARPARAATRCGPPGDALVGRKAISGATRRRSARPIRRAGAPRGSTGR
jgi:hypothetical protein